MKIIRQIAAWLAPDMARNEQRYYYLRNQVSDAHRWLGEHKDAADLAQWLLELDADHWRALGTSPIGTLPSRIDDFREVLRRRAGVAQRCGA